MASCLEDWQSTKSTVLERSRYMFNNPVMSDVVFTCEGSDKKFFAHKYVLATSSAVFYALFYGQLAENSNVQLSDADEESLQEFLRFVYTDECKLTTDNVVNVLYLANKYIVPSLAQKCYKFFDENVSPIIVFTILQQAIQIYEEMLEKKCWDLIDLKTSDAVASDAFVDINHATLLQLLKREKLKIEEVDLFQAVLKWSEAECLRKGIEINAKNKRAVLGNAIYQIRFSSMTLQEFAQNTSSSGLLSFEEMVLFYETFGGEKRASEVWNMSGRSSGEEELLLRCSRFRRSKILCGVVVSSVLYDGTDEFDGDLSNFHTLGVVFSKAVRIHGVRLFGESGNEFDVTLEVLSQQVHKKCYAEKGSDGVSGFDVMLPTPVKVQADVPVLLKATIAGDPSLPVDWVNGRENVNVNGITVKFFTVPAGNNNTNVRKGQFYEIILSKC